MNKQLEESAKALNSWICSEPIIQEYLHLEEALNKHPELLSLEEEIKQLQKTIVQKKHKDLPCGQEIEEYKRKKDFFTNHPLIVNYLNAQEDVNSLLYEVENNIRLELTKSID